MKQEYHVVSFDLSNQLKEMGLLQNGIFGWYQYENQKPFVNLKDYQNFCYNENLIRDGNVQESNLICDAPTVAELGEMLKQHANNLPQWNKYNMGARWFSDIYIPKGYCQVNEETEADARAKMWIYLKKEKIIK